MSIDTNNKLNKPDINCCAVISVNWSLVFSISFFNSNLMQVGVLDNGGGGCVWIPLDINITNKWKSLQI